MPFGDWAISARTLAHMTVAAAMTTSAIVFSEPAIADAMMGGVLIAIPVLGAARYGKVSLVNFAMWLGFVALGIAATGFSQTFDTALKHQLVTLFLAGGAFVLAGYIAADPVPRIALVFWCYTIACLIATVAAIAGYFSLVPSAYDLFTNYGRARGTFKDPNVYGAALGPAITFAAWIMFREPAKRALVAAFVVLPMIIGLLLCFSRGAWISVALSIAILGAITLFTSRRRTDFHRMGMVGVTGVVTATLALFAVMQVENVRALLDQRASLDQSYDVGPEGRFGGQEKARGLILENPLGIGTHTFRDKYHHEEPHNVYLSQFLNAGWLGGMLYAISVMATLIIGLRAALRNGALQGGIVVATAAFAGLVFEGFVIDTDHWRHFFILMACIWGLADAQAPDIDPTRRRDDPVETPIA
ncbi:MAG TPA: O-antigen ligase family protein [Hyphomicrobium sp.]|nr:O-antigen ligase family protein [Hyphomicrobium sp.]